MEDKMVGYIQIKIPEDEKKHIEKAVKVYSEKERLKFNLSERIRQLALKWADDVLDDKKK